MWVYCQFSWPYLALQVTMNSEFVLFLYSFGAVECLSYNYAMLLMDETVVSKWWKTMLTICCFILKVIFSCHYNITATRFMLATCDWAVVMDLDVKQMMEGRCYCICFYCKR